MGAKVIVAMVPKSGVVLVVLCAAFAAGASEGSLSRQDEPADLRALQADVRKVAEEIDGMEGSTADNEADAMATGDLGDAAPTLTALPHKPTPLEQLESADTAGEHHTQEQSIDAAAVQAQDTANDLEQEAENEDEAPASKADADTAIDLANNLKQSDLLPPGWEEKTDSLSGKNYYENKAAGKTTWDPPRSLVSIALAAARGQREAQTQISSLKMKLEEMSSSKDLGESSSVAVSCEHQKATYQKAAVLHVKQFLSKMDKLLNLTGEQQKLLAEQMKSIPTSFIVEPASDPAKLANKVVVATPKKEAANKDLGESMQEDQAAKDKIAMVQAEAAAQKAAQEAAVKEATRLHDTDVQIQKEVAAAAQKKDRELAKQDKDLENSAKADDKLTAEIMGPKATRAERREEKVLLGESASTVDRDNEESSSEESTEDELGESLSTDEDAQDDFAVEDDKDDFEASPNVDKYEEE